MACLAWDNIGRGSVRHKPGIVALLRPGRDGWSADDWLAFFDERAGIAEFDGESPRAEGRDNRPRDHRAARP